MRNSFNNSGTPPEPLASAVMKKLDPQEDDFLLNTLTTPRGCQSLFFRRTGQRVRVPSGAWRENYRAGMGDIITGRHTTYPMQQCPGRPIERCKSTDSAGMNL